MKCLFPYSLEVMLIFFSSREYCTFFISRVSTWFELFYVVFAHLALSLTRFDVILHYYDAEVNEIIQNIDKIGQSIKSLYASC